MEQLAVEATNNGDRADYVYGALSNNPATWDKSSVYGCLCDDGWNGFDCSQQSCQQGDDPGTYDQSNEVQLIQCYADAGQFTLSFRQHTTHAIAFDANSDAVQAALSALPSIGAINVTFSNSNKACYSGYESCSIISLRFMTEHGMLPGFPNISIF
jgi:hypothetical protein